MHQLRNARVSTWPSAGGICRMDQTLCLLSHEFPHAGGIRKGAYGIRLQQRNYSISRNQAPADSACPEVGEGQDRGERPEAGIAPPKAPIKGPGALYLAAGNS